MYKAFTRALNAYKPQRLRIDSLRAAWDAGNDRTFRIIFGVVLSMGLLTLAFLMDGPVGKMLTLGSATFWRPLAVYASKAGEGWVVAAVGATVSLGLFFRRRFDASRMVFLVASTGLLTGTTATVMRSLLGRTRPTSNELQGFYGIWHDSHWIIGQYQFGAFPSGHSATVIGLATAAWLLDRRFGMLTGFYAVLVSWSRIALACHHFSDIIAAGILGVYGAHLVLTRLSPIVHSLARNLRDTWLARKPTMRSSRKPSQA